MELITSDYKITKEYEFSNHLDTLRFQYIDDVYLFANNDDFCKYDSYYISNIGEFKLLRHIPIETENNNGLITLTPIVNLVLDVGNEVPTNMPLTSQFGRLYFGRFSSISIDGECQLVPFVEYNEHNSVNLDSNFGFETSGDNLGIWINSCFMFKLKSFIYNKDYDTFYDYLSKIYGDENLKLPYSISYTYDDVETSLRLGYSYDFSLYGVTYSYGVKDVQDPNYVEE